MTKYSINTSCGFIYGCISFLALCCLIPKYCGFLNNCTLDYRGRARPMSRALCYLGWSCTFGDESSQVTPKEKSSLKTNGHHTTRQDETSLFFNCTKNDEEWCFHSKRWQLGWKGGVAALDCSVCVLMSTQHKVSSTMKNPLALLSQFCIGILAHHSEIWSRE